MKAHHCLFVFCFFIFSCSSKLNGKIENRGDNNVYIVNTSSYKIFKFTVKTTKVTNGTVYEYSTKRITLAPGDENFLGVVYDTADATYPMVDVTKLNIYIKVPDSLRGIKNQNIFFEHEGFPITIDTVVGGTPVLVLYYKDPLKILKINATRDTILGGFSGKYELVTAKEKSKIPNPRDKIKYIYKVTGQVEIKPKY